MPKHNEFFSTLLLSGICTNFSFYATAQTPQENCVTDVQYMKGSYQVSETGCQPEINIVMNTCALTLDFSMPRTDTNTSETREHWFQEHLNLRTRLKDSLDYGVYLPISFLSQTQHSDLFDRFAAADEYKWLALQDRVSSERASDFFWAVYGYIMYSTFDQAHGAGAAKTTQNYMAQGFQSELSHYFWEKPWLKSPKLSYLATCAALCGTEAIDMRALTRSTVFQSCLNRHNAIE